MNKLMLGIIALVLLVLISDFTSRFVQGKPQANNSFNTQTNNAQPLPLLSTSAKQQLKRLFSGYDQPKKTTQADTGLSAAKQAAQNGELLSVFAGDLELKLKAVIYSATPYALIEQKNTKNQQTELVKYTNEQSVAGYTLTILSNTQVALSKNKQQITLVMYQRG
tara:strand:+ start:720 stop:1214 length:495 start_codon:yes stop_codon:yes gene_type:complete